MLLEEFVGESSGRLRDLWHRPSVPVTARIDRATLHIPEGAMSSLPSAERFAPQAVTSVHQDDGGVVLRSPLPLAPYARCLGDLLVHHASATPDRTFLAERPGGGATGWREVSYARCLADVRALASALLDLGATPARPLLLLSDNGVDHALLQLAAMHAGVPVAPVSPAYSLQATDHGRLRDIAAQLAPAVVWADDGVRYARALDAVTTVPGLSPPTVVHSSQPHPRLASVSVDALRGSHPGERLARAFAAVGPDTVAKVLFTSGSTGAPRGVVNTQRMLCSNQQAIAQVWPFLSRTPPVVVDWLPWSHTFGGNHDFNMVLHHGGTLYVDPGRPAPGAIMGTVQALREVSPTLYFNVPRGFDVLLPYLESDDGLRARFFHRLDVIFYAAAALPQPLWQRLEAVAERAGARGVAMLSAWGSTETSPLATSVHFAIPRAGVIGLPPPGTDVKLAPVPGTHRFELRVRGPNVTPGWWLPGGAIQSVHLDPEGYLPTGDAGRLQDPADPSRGVVFDGRLAENFKLTTGTWVSVGALRLAVITACAPLVQDAVIAGHDRDAVTVLLVPSLPACRALCGEGAQAWSVESVLSHPPLREAVRTALAAHNRGHPGSSTRVARAVWLSQPPTIDGGEITDKGYINQRAVLTRRASLVEGLYAPVPAPEVISLDGL